MLFCFVFASVFFFLFFFFLCCCCCFLFVSFAFDITTAGSDNFRRIFMPGGKATQAMTLVLIRTTVATAETGSVVSAAIGTANSVSTTQVLSIG